MKYTVEDQSKNGVRVIVYRFPNRGTVVEASCQCFGNPYRVCSTMNCLKRVKN